MTLIYTSRIQKGNIKMSTFSKYFKHSYNAALHQAYEIIGEPACVFYTLPTTSV